MEGVAVDDSQDHGVSHQPQESMLSQRMREEMVEQKSVGDDKAEDDWKGLVE